METKRPHWSQPWGVGIFHSDLLKLWRQRKGFRGWVVIFQKCQSLHWALGRMLQPRSRETPSCPNFGVAIRPTNELMGSRYLRQNQELCRHLCESGRFEEKGRYTSYAWICVYMNITEPLLDYIELEYHDEVWPQPLGYEHIPFWCFQCHEYGNLFRACTLNQ